LDFVRKEEKIEIVNRVDATEALDSVNLVEDIADDIDSMKIEYKSDSAHCAMNGDAIKASSSPDNGELSRNATIEEQSENNFTQNKHSFNTIDDIKLNEETEEKKDTVDENTKTNQAKIEHVEESKREKVQAEESNRNGTKKESVAECLRRYKEEEAKARRAEQMRKNYTLIEDEQPVSSPVKEKKITKNMIKVETCEMEEKPSLMMMLLLGGLVVLLLLVATSSVFFQNAESVETAHISQEQVLRIPRTSSIVEDYIQYTTLAEAKLRK